MEIVVVERRFAAPVSAAGVQADDAAARWCFDQYRCQPSFHLLRLDGRQLCCVFRAPDLEAIRRTAQALGMTPPDAAWQAVLDAPEDDLAKLGERAAAAAADGRLVVVEASDDAAAQALAEPGRHTVLGSFLATDRRRLLGLCRSADGSTTGPSRERRRAHYWPAVVIMP
jgi:hypothetical protein